MQNHNLDDPYVYPGTNILKNKFGIKHFGRLQSVEAIIFHKQYCQFLPEGNLDYYHLKALHKHFFSEVYEWAGKERTVDIAKNNSYFAHTEFISSSIEKVFTQLKSENYLIHTDQESFCERLSFYFNEINAVHPFREGNGRILRIFCEQLAQRAGYQLDWRKVDMDVYLEANIRGFIEGDYKPMEKVFNSITTKLHLEVKADIQHHVTLTQTTIKMLSKYLEHHIKLIDQVKTNNQQKITQSIVDYDGISLAKLLNENLNKMAFEIINNNEIAPIASQVKALDLTKTENTNKILERVVTGTATQKDYVRIIAHAYKRTQILEQHLSNTLHQNQDLLL